MGQPKPKGPVIPAHQNPPALAYPKATFITLEGSQSDDSPFPEFIQNWKGQDSGVRYEWDPENKHEMIVGYLAQKTKMTLGGMAYTLNVLGDYANPKGPTEAVLIKRGGRVLENRMEELQAEPGDCLCIMFLGYGDAKPGQSAPRLWKVRKLHVQ